MVVVRLSSAGRRYPSPDVSYRSTRERDECLRRLERMVPESRPTHDKPDIVVTEFDHAFDPVPRLVKYTHSIDGTIHPSRAGEPAPVRLETRVPALPPHILERWQLEQAHPLGLPAAGQGPETDLQVPEPRMWEDPNEGGVPSQARKGEMSPSVKDGEKRDRQRREIGNPETETWMYEFIDVVQPGRKKKRDILERALGDCWLASWLAE